MYGRRNGYLFQRMAVGENAVADMDDFVRNVDTCKAVASFECGIAEIDHGGGQRDRREGNTAGKTVAFELQQSLGELYFRQAFTIGVFATYCKSIYYILNGRIVITLIL